MKKIIRTILISLGVISFLGLTFIVVGDSYGNTQDLFGFRIPTPPAFLSFIPIVGYILGIIFEMFSLHGLITIAISFGFIGLGLSIKD